MMQRLPLLPGCFAFETNFAISCSDIIRGRNCCKSIWGAPVHHNWKGCGEPVVAHFGHHFHGDRSLVLGSLVKH